MNKKEVSERVKLALKAIREKEYTKKELQSFYNNIIARDDITEDEKELLTNEIELKVRTTQPRLATEIFGNKEAKAREFLDPVFSELFEEYDWSKNIVDSRVKVCGHMINGSNYICLYISYKNNSGISTALAYKQVTPNDDPFLSVNIRQVRKGDIKAKMIKEKHFSIGSEEEAVEYFKKHLSDTIKE